MILHSEHAVVSKMNSSRRALAGWFLFVGSSKEKFVSVMAKTE
jgi:hypothetical protein